MICDLGFLSLVSPAAIADDWQKYTALLGNFYLLDQQEFKSISCSIDVSTLDELLANLKQQVSSLKDDFQIDDTLNKYSLSFDKAAGLRIVDPTLGITILTEQGMANPALVKSGISKTTDGFNGVAQGADKEITGVFDSYIMPKQADIKLESVAGDSGHYVARYVKGGLDTMETMDGSDIRSVQTSQGINAVAESHYGKTDGDKFLMLKSEVHMDMAQEKIDMGVSVTYQKVDLLQLPETIIVKGTVSLSTSMQMQVATTITLNNCQVVK
jgi:hypothetical protein